LKLAILSRNTRLYSTQRLAEAGLNRGHDVRVVDYLRCFMNITSHKPSVIYGDEELRFDAVIPRIGASNTFYGTAVVRQFEMMGTFCANESQAITRSRDKLRSMQLLARDGIGLPVTGIAHAVKDIKGLMDTVGTPPFVVKLLEGTQGRGVVLAETKKAAESVIGAFRQLDANILVQEFIKEAGGRDIRALVVGGRVVAAIERTAADGDFRANLHRGATASAIKLLPEERRLAARAAKVLGLNIAGVDMMRSNHGAVVIEVNSSPGLEGVETTTGLDAADRIVAFIEKSASAGSTRDRVKG